MVPSDENGGGTQEDTSSGSSTSSGETSPAPEGGGGSGSGSSAGTQAGHVVNHGILEDNTAITTMAVGAGTKSQFKIQGETSADTHVETQSSARSSLGLGIGKLSSNTRLQSPEYLNGRSTRDVLGTPSTITDARHKVDSRIVSDFSRTINRPALPSGVKMPETFVPRLVMEDIFNDLKRDTSPKNWVVGKLSDIAVTNEISYTYPNSARISFLNSNTVVPVTRALAPDISLSDTRPLVLQFFANFGTADTKASISVQNKSMVQQVETGPLFEISRTAKEVDVNVQYEELTVSEDMDSKYYYETGPTESKSTDNIAYAATDSMSITSRKASVDVSVNPVKVKKAILEKRKSIVETINIKYGGPSGTIESVDTVISPTDTNRKSKVKLYGWNGFAAVFFQNTFDFYINGDKVIDGGEYLVSAGRTGLTNNYAGLLQIGPSSLQNKDTVGTLYVDMVSMYALGPAVGESPSGYVYVEETPVILPEEMSYYISNELTDTVSGSSDVEYDEEGCVIVRLGDIQLLQDINGSFTISTETECSPKYLSLTDAYIDEMGRFTVMPADSWIRRATATKAFIKQDGTIIVGSYIDNRLDVIPFDYEQGEFVLLTVLSTNDSRYTPILKKLTFELE